jgi:hypothetical protein
VRSVATGAETYTEGTKEGATGRTPALTGGEINRSGDFLSGG